MTSISSISSGSSSYYQVAAVASRQRPAEDDPMKRVAQTLDLSADDLREELSGGKSLNDVATAQGVAHDDLISAIRSGMPASSVITDDVAEKIAAQRGTPPPPPGGPRGENAGLRDSEKLQQVSELLDMDSEDVTKAATSASSLVSLLQTKGVDFTQLKDVLNRSGDLLDVSA